ncbi:ATP-binding cassette domain-containing protein [Mycoplasmatota bacterium]|nr:ATP-binding cassette domain-containing protein [Mycoplasmatota bacterium]
MDDRKLKLHVEDLAVSFRTNQGLVQAVRGINFDLYEGETLAIVGESGSGKSVSSRTIMGILASNGFIKDGKIIYEGQDLTKVTEEHFHELRGNKIGMIFQDPMSSLNPIMRIGKQITEGMLLNGHRLKNREKSIYKTQKNVYYELLNDQKQLKEEFKTFKKNYRNAIRFGVRDIKNEYNNKIEDAKKQKEFNIFDAKNNIKFTKLDIQTAKKGLNDAQNEAERKSYEAKINEYEKKVEALNNDIINFKEQYKEDKKNLTEEKKQKIAEFKESKSNERKEVKEKIAQVKSQYSDPDALKEKLAEVSLFHEKKLNYERNMAELKEKFEPAKKAFLDAKKEAKEVVKKEWEEEKAKTEKEIEKIKAEQESSSGRSEQVAEKEAKLNDLLGKKETLKSTYKQDYSDAITSREKEEIKNQYAFDLSELESEIKNAKEELKIEKNYFKVQIAEAKEKLNRFKKVTKKEAYERAITIMEEVGIPQPEKRFRQYPFQFSGGMRQRIVIAIALTANPDVLICDEPTTALDVTIQAQILELINKLKVERNLSVIFITHDLGVVANMADRIGVMYAGKIVELGTTEDIFYDPKHPYTWALLSSMPDINTKERLLAIPGTPPNMLFPPKGDAFADRNQYAMKIDFEKQPPMFKVSETHSAATWLLHENAPKAEMPEIVKNRINRMLNQDKGVKSNG